MLKIFILKSNVILLILFVLINILKQCNLVQIWVFCSSHSKNSANYAFRII